jgi:hypothetical protein
MPRTIHAALTSDALFLAGRSLARQATGLSRGRKTHKNQDDASSVGTAKQQIPVALFADEENRAFTVRRRARNRAAHCDKVWHLRYRSGREENGLSNGAVIFARLVPAGSTSVQEEARTIRPASGAEHICEVFTDHGNLRDADQCVAQHGSVPQAGGDCRRRRAALIHRSRACMSKPLLVNHGRKVELRRLATSTASNGARRVSHTCRHIGQKEHCVSAPSSVIHACGDAHRGPLT